MVTCTATPPTDGSKWSGKGNHSDGETLDAATTNGGVHAEVPGTYSERLATGTVNGGIHVGFPVTVQGAFERQLSLTMGSGGALVRVMTTNGRVRISKCCAL